MIIEMIMVMINVMVITHRRLVGLAAQHNQYVLHLLRESNPHTTICVKGCLKNAWGSV